jgi:hypothetical protein
MSWVDSEGLERGGACNECGAQVEEPYHAYCSDCYAAMNGWHRPEHPGRDALEHQHEDRQRVTVSRLVELVSGLDRRLAALERATCRGTA